MDGRGASIGNSFTRTILGAGDGQVELTANDVLWGRAEKQLRGLPARVGEKLRAWVYLVSPERAAAWAEILGFPPTVFVKYGLVDADCCGR